MESHRTAAVAAWCWYHGGQSYARKPGALESERGSYSSLRERTWLVDTAAAISSCCDHAGSRCRCCCSAAPLAPRCLCPCLPRPPPPPPPPPPPGRATAAVAEALAAAARSDGRPPTWLHDERSCCDARCMACSVALSNTTPSGFGSRARRRSLASFFSCDRPPRPSRPPPTCTFRQR